MKCEKIIGLLMAVAVLMAGCANDDEYTAQGKLVNVELGYAFSSPGSSALTRQAAEVITSETTRPRLPYYLRLIPFVNNAPQLSEISWENPVSKDDPRSRFYRSGFCNLNIGVNGFLVYGSVDNEAVPENTYANPKMYNGSLIENFPSSITAVNDVLDGISFNLESIYPDIDVIPDEAQTLAGYMNAITQVTGWGTSTNDLLKGLLTKFTNDGNCLPGSAASVKVWIEKFMESVQTSLDNSATPEDIKTILTAIQDTAQTQVGNIGDINATSYPRNLHLPDGAAVLRWADVKEGEVTVKKFVPQIKATTIDNINSMARFAYPAPLYYFIASEIKTSEEKVDFATIYDEVQTNGTKTAWDQVLENTKFNKTSVSANTKAVALTHPVQYAVAQLKVKIKAYTENLPDGANPAKSIHVSGTNFPLKGIVVCDQRPLNYRFEPKEIEQGAVSDAEVLFIYDNQVKSDCYLTTQAEGTWAEGCNTLVLQSYKNEDVNIILEFENNSGEQFTCIDGIVYPGTRFYLIGKVEASLYNSPDPNVHSENKDQVFTKDYITTVNMTVSSLARAYNVPPNLLSNNLEIGVETTPQWEAATPTIIRLE